LHCDGLGDDLHCALFQRQYVVVQSAETLSIMLGVDPVALLEAGDPLAVLDYSRPCEFGEAALIEPVTRQRLIVRGAHYRLLRTGPHNDHAVIVGVGRVRAERQRGQPSVCDDENGRGRIRLPPDAGQCWHYALGHASLR